MEVVGAIILGLLAGAIAKLLVPGDDPGGFFVTIMIGLAGALVGYAVFTLGFGIGDDDVFDLGGLIGAVLGAIALLLLYRKFAGPSKPSNRATPRMAGR